MRKFTDYEINDIIQTYKQTGSLTKTSEKHKTTNGKIKTLLTKHAGITDFSLDIKIDEDMKQNIIKDYLIDKLPLGYFEQKYGLLTDTLLKNIKAWGITPNRASNSGKRGRRKLTPEQEKEICRLYVEEELSTWKIGPKFDVLNVCILQVLRRNNVLRRTRSKAARIYDLDETYFERCDSPSKAYFLGLMYAEGHCEIEGRNSITLSLAEEDKYIVEFLSRELKSNRPLEFRKKKQEHHKNAYVLRISSLKFMEDLDKLGLPMGKKSHTIIFPGFLDESLYKYFILSYFDGDGCVGVYKDNLKMMFAGNIYFLEGLKQYLKKTLNINSRLFIKNETTGGLDINTQYEAVRLYSHILENTEEIPIYMTRKFNKFKNFIIQKLKYLNSIKLNKTIWKKELLEKSLKTIQKLEDRNIIKNAEY